MKPEDKERILDRCREAKFKISHAVDVLGKDNNRVEQILFNAELEIGSALADLNEVMEMEDDVEENTSY